MSQANNRYEYIDFLRGVSSIGIIAIHSAFWGGKATLQNGFGILHSFWTSPFSSICQAGEPVSTKAM